MSSDKVNERLRTMILVLTLTSLGVSMIQAAKGYYPATAIVVGRKLEKFGKRLMDDGFDKLEKDLMV